MAFFFVQMSDGESTHEWSMGAPFPSFDRRLQSPSVRERVMRGQAFPTLTSPWVVPQISEISPRPASSNALTLVQTSVVGGEQTVPDCAICLEPILKGQTVAVMPCEGRHGFHNDCVFEWLKKRNTCPNCRFALEAESQDQDQDDINDSMTGWIRYTDFHDYQDRLLLTDPQYQRLMGHVPVAQPIPVAEALPWAGDGPAPWVDDAQLARARYDADDYDEDASEDRWGVGLGVGVDADGAIVVTDVVRHGPADSTGQARRPSDPASNRSGILLPERLFGKELLQGSAAKLRSSPRPFPLPRASSWPPPPPCAPPSA